MESKFGYNAILGPIAHTVEFILFTGHWCVPPPAARSPHKCPSPSEDCTLSHVLSLLELAALKSLSKL